MATRAAATRRAKGGAAAPGAREASSPVARALSLLETVAGFASPPRFSEIEGAAGLPKATLHRMLRLLEGEGALRFDAHARRYSLGLRLIRLARSSWDSASLAEVARPHLDALFARHGVTLHLACLDSGHVLYLDKRAARVSPTIFSAVGRIGPAYCTGVGKAMLAALPAAELDAAIARQSFEAHTPNTIRDARALRRELARVRNRGFSVDDEEHEPGVVCAAAAILGADSRPIGALSMTALDGARGLRALEARAPDLLAAAAAIAADARAQMLDRSGEPPPKLDGEAKWRASR